jgi:hypothetical protein
MGQNTSAGRYSAVVKLTLLAGGQVYPLAQVGPEFVILKTAAIIPPGPATVVTVVDGDERRSDVMVLESSEPSDIIRTVRAATPVIE